jgi:ADP-ribose pyrophosphatase YjhB (NUDIX family)
MYTIVYIMTKRYKDVPVEDTKLRFRPSLAVDGVVFALFDTDESDEKFYSGEAHVLLVKRNAIESKGKRKGKARPDLGYWALPGGFVRSQETLEDAVVRELAEETLFPTKEFLSAHKDGIVGLQQVKTYSEPKRDSWNFDKDVKPGEHRRTVSSSFLVTVPNSMFTRNLAKGYYYLKNNKLLHIDMDTVLPYIIKDVGNKLDTMSGLKDDDQLSKEAWDLVDQHDEPNKFLKENTSLNLQNFVKDGPILNPEKGPVGERKISLGGDNFGDATEAAFFPIKEVLEGKIEKGRLAFDHDQILTDAVNHFTESLAFSPIALDLCEEEFTISDVRGVYQAFWDLTYGVSDIDLGNFQNKMLKLTDIDGKNVFIPTNKKRQMDRYKYNGKREIIKVKGGPALLYKKNKNLKNFNLAIVPPKKR